MSAGSVACRCGFFPGGARKRRKETGGKRREVACRESVVVWFTERGRGRQVGRVAVGRRLGGREALNWGGGGRRQRGGFGGTPRGQRHSGGWERRVWAWTHWPPLGHWPSVQAGSPLGLVQGVGGIVGRGGCGWPMAAGQSPSGGRLAALATVCFTVARLTSLAGDGEFAVCERR